MEVVSVKQINGVWRMTVNEVLVGDARAHPTKEAAIDYCRKVTKGWADVVFRF